MFRRALAALVSATLDVASPVDAQAQPQEQEAPPPGEAEKTARGEATEEIVVTGSRVRRKDLTTPAPVTVVTTSRKTLSPPSAKV